jgi:hypothetical protein
MNQIIQIIIWICVIVLIVFFCYKFVMYVFTTDFSNPEADAYESLAGLSGGALLLLRKYTKKGKKNKR